MKRIFLVFAAALLALVLNACEKHSRAETASALHSEHIEEPHIGATQTQSTGHVSAEPAPHAPQAVPTNPAGSGPTHPHDPNLDKGTSGSGDPGAYKYFPKGGNK